MIINDSLPKIYENIFDENYFKYLKKYLNEYKFPEGQTPDYYGSYRLMSFDGDAVLLDAQNKITPKAKEIFKNDNILPSYCTYMRYLGDSPSVKMHVDNSPSTYLIDVCLGYNTQWPIYVKDKVFNIEENCGLAFYADTQKHGRPEFPDPDNNIVEMIMFGFTNPNHIWWKIKEEERGGIVKRFLAQDPSYNTTI